MAISLDWSGDAGVGEEVVLHVDHSEQRRTQVRIYLKGRLIHTAECPDPPCHEMTFTVPSNAIGQLVVRARAGRERQTLRIAVGARSARAAPDAASE